MTPIPPAPPVGEEGTSGPPEVPITVGFTRRAAAGDERAFEQLYERHHARVLRVTALRLGRMLDDNAEDIEDAVQFAFSDTFLRIREGTVPDIHSDQAFRRYIATAAANRVRSVKRGKETELRGRDWNKVGTGSLCDMLGTRQPGPRTLMELQELERSLEASVLGLPQAYRTAIEMHSYLEMSYAEIAESEQLVSPSGKVVSTPDGVRMIVHRARKLLNAVVDHGPPSAGSGDDPAR